MAFRNLVTAGLLVVQAFAAPAPEPVVQARAAAITNEAQLQSALSSFSSAPVASQSAAYLALMSAIQPSATPTNAQAAATRLSAVYSAHPSDFFGQGASILLNGLSGASNFGNLINGFGACNSYNNVNPPSPKPIYPKKSANDAPYDVSEQSLRSAIYIPPGFTYGRVPPLLFIPGTGTEACETFTPNLAQLFAGSNYADAVFVNVPNNQLDDIQTNAEYTAYAINYINAVTNRNVSIATWSQGAISSQWSFKYWPSTRNVTSDILNVSPDYHGTIEAPIICPPGTPCAPSVLQQNYNSIFIQTLRNNGGSNAYVPTTEVHSIFDEIVEPQQDPFASATIGQGAGGATNVQIQSVCSPGTPAGFPNFGHEASLYNEVTFNVFKDALTNAGPANVARSGASSQCSQYTAPGLTLANIFATEALIPLAGFNIETYPNKVTTEPPIKAYAAADAPR